MVEESVTSEQAPKAMESSSITRLRLTQGDYEKLPEEEQEKLWAPMPEEKLKELEDACEAFALRRGTLFTSIMGLPKVDWLVEGIAVKEGITLLYGDAGIGKTSFMLQLIGCLAEGKKFLDLEMRKANVLLIEQDEGKSLLRSHIEIMLPVYPSLQWLEVPKVQLRWDNEKQDFEAKGSLLGELICYSSAQIVVIDSVTSLGIEDINHPITALLFDRLRELAGKYHCAFVLLHHPNKSGDVMGSNLIKAKVDSLLELKDDRLIFQKLRGKTPEGTTTEPGHPPYLQIKRSPDTLTYILVTDRADMIQNLWLQGKQRADIIDLVCEAYPGTKRDTAGKAVDRERTKLTAQGKLTSIRDLK